MRHDGRYHRVVFLTLALIATCQILCSAEEAANALVAKKERAIAAIEQGGYEHLITQHAATGKAPDSSIFVLWILDEINNDSAMRDQIGDELAEIENNGHNDNWLTVYYTRDKQWHRRACFKSSDVRTRLVDKSHDGDYRYETVLKAKDGFHGGVTIKSFRFTFMAHVEYFPFTKAYQIKVTSYPKYDGKNEKEERLNGS
jgi:hypothetical protein